MSTPALKPRPSARKITACVSGSSPPAVRASASSNQPRDGMALTGGESTVTAPIPGSVVRDVIVIEILGHFLGGRLPKQALAWYASTVTHAEGGPAISFGLDGRVTLVTGGVRGVGAGISSVFAGQGATVVTCARRAVEGLPYEFHSCDVRDDDAVKAMIDAIIDRHGRLDVVVNNAGGSPYVLTAEASAKFNRKIIELNLIGALSVSQHANDRMQDQPGGGSIVNICSLSGRRPSPGTGAYGAAKAGLESLTQTLAVEWGPKVRVNACVVGMVETEQSELFYGDADSIAAISKNVPLGRLALPHDVGWGGAFLASNAASYISGASLELHGGGEPPHYLATTNASAIK